MMQDYLDILSLLFVLGILTYAIYSLLFTNAVLSSDPDEEVYLVEVNNTSSENIKEIEKMYQARIASLEDVSAAWANGARWEHGAYVSDGQCVASNDALQTHDRCEYVALVGKKPQNVNVRWNNDKWSRYE